ncbi:hypothetical protein [Amycolatopsis cihanbeyliensis]|uniref:Integral membrane protein n=1 Tax=Amycolatopsis cihanbeyliensis TaxID=1128664 RepID=A0A542DK26_AMYCI|nr:hypothetical protein [Amycolatopsis cihanbeyliensis]TQJ03448.1 hypothetical protein FB471_3208 [Amycolatopsis cihanbeyliensis]
MVTWLATAVALCSLAVACWSFVSAARGRSPKDPLLIAIAVVEVLLLAQVVVSVVLLISGERPGGMATFIAYLVGSLAVLPVATLWALAERSRSSTVVLGIACVTVPVLILRMHEVWGGAGA